MFCSTGQNTGSEAHIVATSTSRAARTIGVGPYQVGSNLQYPESAGVKSPGVYPSATYVGEVVARVSTIDARRHMEKILALLKS